MGFRNNAYATVWENKNGVVVDDKGKYAVVNITISYRNKKENKWETDYSGFVMFVGKAYDKIKDMELFSKNKLRLLFVDRKVKKGSDGQYRGIDICMDFEDPKDSEKTIKNPEVVDGSGNEADIGELPF